MRRYFLVFTITFILSLLQTSFLSELMGSEATPNLILSLAFALLIAEQFDLSMFSAVAGGIFLDLSGYTLIGINVVLSVFMVMIVYLIRKYVFKNFYFQVFMVFLASVLYDMFIFENGFRVRLNALFFLLMYLSVQYTFLRDLRSEYKVN